MSDEKTLEKIIDHLYGELDPAGEESLLAEAETEPGLSDEIDRTRKILTAYRLAPALTPPAGAARAALSCAHRQIALQTPLYSEETENAPAAPDEAVPATPVVASTPTHQHSMKIVISSAEAAQLRTSVSAAPASESEASQRGALSSTVHLSESASSQAPAAEANDSERQAETELVLPALQMPVEPVLVMPEREVNGWFWSVGKVAAAIVIVAVSAALLLKKESAPAVQSSSRVAQLQDATPVQPPKATGVKRMENRKAEVNSALPVDLPSVPVQAKTPSLPAAPVAAVPELKSVTPASGAAALQPAADEKKAELFAQVDSAQRMKPSADDRASNMTPGLRKPESAEPGIVIEDLPHGRKSKAAGIAVGQVPIAVDKGAVAPVPSVKPQLKTEAPSPVVAVVPAPEKPEQVDAAPVRAAAATPTPPISSAPSGRIAADAPRSGLAARPVTPTNKHFVLPQVTRQRDLPVMPEAEEPVTEHDLDEVRSDEINLPSALPSAPDEERAREKPAAPVMLAKGSFERAAASAAPKQQAPLVNPLPAQKDPVAATSLPVAIAPEKPASHPAVVAEAVNEATKVPAVLPEPPVAIAPAQAQEITIAPIAVPAKKADLPAAAPLAEKELREESRVSSEKARATKDEEVNLPPPVRISPVPAAPIAPVEMPEIPAISAPALPAEPVASATATAPSASVAAPAPTLSRVPAAPLSEPLAEKKDAALGAQPAAATPALPGLASGQGGNVPVPGVGAPKVATEARKVPAAASVTLPDSHAPAVTQTELTLSGRESAQQLLAAGRRLYEADAVMRGLFAIDEALEKGLQDAELEEALTLKARMELKLRRFASMQETIDRLKPINRVAAQALEVLRSAALSRLTPAARQAAESAPPPPPQPTPAATMDEPARTRQSPTVPQGQAGTGAKKFSPNTDPYYR